MLVSNIIIKLIINLILWYYYFLFSLWLCFKIENLFGTQFGELVYKITQETLVRRSSFDR